MKPLAKWPILLAAMQMGSFGTAIRAEDEMARDFAKPPAATHPGIFAFMLPYGPVPDEAIKRDIQEMRAKGIQTCIIYTPGAGVARRDTKLVYGETENRVEPTKEYLGAGVIDEVMGEGNKRWSDEWRNSIRVAAKEAARVGLEYGFSIEGAGNREPQVLPLEYSKQTLVFSSTNIKGGARVEAKLPLPEKVPLQEDKTPLFYRDITVLAVPAHGDVQPSQIVDVTSSMSSDGQFRWDAPAGDWSILRFGHTVDKNPLVYDHLTAETVEKRWEIHTGKLLADMTPEERKGLQLVECDSYEGGPQTWSKHFADDFRKLRGYDILNWMPVLAGRVVVDADQSARFQRDYRLTISDLFIENFYAKNRALAKVNGLTLYAEGAGPHQLTTDLLKTIGRCDVSMGEFWMPGTHRGVEDPTRFLLRDAAAAAHGYGMKEVFCEAFTGGNDCWREAPFQLKPCADQAFCDGLTRPCIHGYTISPWNDDAPGVVYWAGTYFNRHTTWWNQSPAFLDYLARCTYLLQQGVFVADVAFFNGDGIGKPVPRKAERGELAGLYDYDMVNSEILLTRMNVKDGRIVLPDGLSYRLLALSGNDPLQVEVLRKLVAMVEAGATILGSRPSGPYGLKDDPAEFTALADKLWGAGQPTPSGEKAFGKGRVVWGKPVLQFLKDDGVLPDVEFAGVSPKGVMDWIHRKSGDEDIYFVSSRWQPVEQVECTFRVSGKLPELWDPVTGKAREAGAFRQENGRTIVPIRFDPCGSTFVIFRKPTTEVACSGKNWDEFKPLQEITGPWTVSFDPKWGGPQEVRFDRLADWTTRAEEGIKYYSGKATYRKTFDLPALPKTKTYLNLGDVRELAAVRLNGRDLGVLWTKPFQVDVTDALKIGTNSLEIDVVNLWPNRLTGDTFLPKEKRFARTNMTKYTQASQLLPSGLLGPVTIQSSLNTKSP